MGEDQDKKTEKPSSRKLDEAQKKGQVAKSKEVVSALVLLVASAYLYAAWGDIIQYFQNIITAPARFYHLDFNTATKQLSSYILTVGFAYIALPFVALLFVVTAVVNIAQVGFIFSFESITPTPDKINPISGFGKIFSKKTLVETFFSLLKIILISLVIWYVISFALSIFPSHPGQCDLNCYRLILQALTFKMITLLIPLFIVMAAFDYMLQKHEFTKQQMMTKDEAKRDHKNSEGDPIVKSARRSFQFEMMFDDFEDRVKYSKIIITDYNKGVSLSYNPGMELPVLFCKCSGGMLSRLLSVGRQESVRIVESTTLTHALFEDGVIDEYIPSYTVRKVAELMK